MYSNRLGIFFFFLFMARKGEDVCSLNIKSTELIKNVSRFHPKTGNSIFCWETPFPRSFCLCSWLLTWLEFKERLHLRPPTTTGRCSKIMFLLFFLVIIIKTNERENRRIVHTFFFLKRTGAKYSLTTKFRKKFSFPQ